jgi:hypothetical protein
MNNEFLTLKEAAAETGLSRMTILRACHRGELVNANPALDLPGQAKAVILRTEDLRSWVNTRTRDGVNIGQARTGRLEQLQGHPEQPTGGVEQPQNVSVPVEVHLLTLESLSEAMTLLGEAHRKAERDAQSLTLEREEKERANRRADHLANELQSYQRVLGEQAESLAEERARRMALELAAVTVDQAEHIIEHVAPPAEPITSENATINQLPSPATSTKREGGWGRRLKRWFLGERTG